MAKRIEINRAPVLTLWAAVVAERLGFDRGEALTLGKAVAGLNAYSKGRALGLFQPRPKGIKEKRRALRSGQEITVDLLGRAVPCQQLSDGLRAVSKDRPITPESVQRYLESKFGDDLAAALAAMTRLAASLPPGELAERGFSLYEAFRPSVPAGTRGWGAAGVLDLDRLGSLARKE